MLALLNKTAGFFAHHFRAVHVALGGLVEGGRNDFALGVALEIGDFLRALVDQQQN